MQKLPFDLATPLAVVCHDAGAANLIFSWLEFWSDAGFLNNYELRLLLRGPAKTSWIVNPISLQNFKICNNFDEALNGSSCVLTGTGWGSSLEHDARQIALELQIPSIGVIDHWVNYEHRFEREGKTVLPNSIWVSDQHALAIAKSIFTSVNILELPNIYLNNIVRTITKLSEDSFNLLYVLEPLRNDWGNHNQGEFQTLDFFVKNIHVISGDIPLTITLRPHPSDPPGKYEQWIQSNSHLKVSLDQHQTLNQSISTARWVVGAETFAMVIAITAGRSTWSSLPPWAHRCRLPQTGIKHLRDYI
jgi:hypothetical protein